MSEKQPIQERLVKGYPPMHYKKMLQVYVEENDTSESKVVSLAIRKLFDTMPKEERQRILTLSQLR